MVPVRKHVKRPPLYCMMQVVPRSIVVVRTQRLAAFNSVLEFWLTGREIDDVDLGVYRGVGT